MFNPFSFIGGLFQRLFTRIEDAWEQMSPWLKSFVVTLFGSVVGVGIEILSPIVRDILIEIQNDPSLVLDNDRRSTAFDRIEKAITEDMRTELIALGFGSLTYLINLAIETVLGYLKENDELPPNAGDE